MTARALRLAVTAATGLSLLAAGGAVAAPKPVCNLVSDAAGDVMLPSAALDVVSADIATDAKKLTGVIRVAKLANSDGTAPTGFAYNFRFKVAGSPTQFYLLASNVPSPIGQTTFEYGTIELNRLTPLGDAKGVLDLAKNEVRVTAPTALGPVTVKPGTKIVDLQAITQRRFVVLLSTADSTVIDEKRTYTAGTPSCVKPGA